MRHFNKAERFSIKRDGAAHSSPKTTINSAFAVDDQEEDDDEVQSHQPHKVKGKLVNGRENDEQKQKQKQKQQEEEEEEEEEEDDYMTMTFTDTPTTAPETSLQRRQRLQKEGLRRGMVPSKQQLAQQERERREQGLSKSLFSAATTPAGDEGILHGEKIAAERRQKAQAQMMAAASLTTTTNKNRNQTHQSKGLAMMAKMGFTPGAALGRPRREEEQAEAEGRMVEPLRIEVREDRGGIGLGEERKRKLREAFSSTTKGEEGQDESDDNDQGGGETKKKKAKKGGGIVVDEGDYRERMAKERDLARKEKLVLAAQKIAERMDEEEEEKNGEGRGATTTTTTTTTTTRAASRPLKAIPVLYRGLVRHREQVERDRRARHDLEASSSVVSLAAKLPTYAEDDGDWDAYDRMALGKDDDDDENENTHLPPLFPPSAIGGKEGGEKDTKKKTTVVVYMPVDDLDEGDDELEAFHALEVDERLRQLVAYLRERFRYCFWCKFVYPDEAMEGCPGVTEEDHD